MIRFFNGRTLTMADGVSVTTDEVWTDGDKIAYIGPTPETLPAFERQIDLGGDLVMPGFKNAHAHAGMSFVRSYADDVPLQPWLFEQIFPLEAKLTPEAVYAFTKLSILEYLTSGITAGFDMYYFREAIAQASIDCGFRTVLCGGGGSAQQLESEYRKFNALHPLISYQLGLHSEYTSNLTEMTEAGELTKAQWVDFDALVDNSFAEKAMELATSMGFPHVNMDLIAGLPGDTPDGFRTTLEQVLALAPENITVHTLSRKRGADLSQQTAPVPDGAQVGEMLDFANTALDTAGYAPYYLYRQKFMSGGFENVGWTRPGQENLYNICIMEELCSILAMGGGASTKLVCPGGRLERHIDPKYPTEYIANIDRICAAKAKLEAFFL